MAYRRMVVILGVPIDDLDMAETLDRVEEMVYTGRSTGRGHQIVTVNADFIVKAMQDPELCSLLQSADLATADGMPIVWGARLVKVPMRSRVTGADMVPALAARAAQKGFSIYFLGAAPGVAAQAASMLRERCPGLKVAGIKSPEISSLDDTPPELLEEIRSAKPDILLVALGNPKQEKWIGRFGQELNVPVMIGVGGTLDFIAGKMRRAPVWMQNSGLEWLYRLIQEPKRLWQRYAVDLFIFSTAFLRQVWAMRRGWRPNTLLPTTEMLLYDETAILNINGELTVNNSSTFNEWSKLSLSLSPFIIVNLEKAEFLDSSAFGTLVGLARQARNGGGQLWLVAPRPQILDTLRLLHLDTFFAIRATIDDCLSEREHLSSQTSKPVMGLSST